MKVVEKLVVVEEEGQAKKIEANRGGTSENWLCPFELLCPFVVWLERVST